MKTTMCLFLGLACLSLAVVAQPSTPGSGNGGNRGNNPVAAIAELTARVESLEALVDSQGTMLADLIVVTGQLNNQVNQLQAQIDALQQGNDDFVGARIESGGSFETFHQPSLHPVFDPTEAVTAFDSHNAVSELNGEVVFTAPESGFYRVSARAIYGGDLNNPIRTGEFQYQRFLLINGQQSPDRSAYSFFRKRVASGVTLQTTDTVYLEAGDVLQFLQMVDIEEPNPQGLNLEKRDTVEIVKIGD